VASRQPKKIVALEVRTMYEPNRLSAACIARAYERLLPIARRTVTPGSNNHLEQRDETKRLVGGAS